MVKAIRQAESQSLFIDLRCGMTMRLVGFVSKSDCCSFFCLAFCSALRCRRAIAADTQNISTATIRVTARAVSAGDGASRRAGKWPTNGISLWRVTNG